MLVNLANVAIMGLMRSAPLPHGGICVIGVVPTWWYHERYLVHGASSLLGGLTHRCIDNWVLLLGGGRKQEEALVRGTGACAGRADSFLGYEVSSFPGLFTALYLPVTSLNAMGRDDHGLKLLKLRAQ